MTWDESELRAALHEGEGEPLSAGHIVALAEARQQRRHDRIRTAAVAVVVTGLLGGGIVALSQLGGGGESAGSDSAAGGQAYSSVGGDQAANGSAASAPGTSGEKAAGGAAPLVPGPQAALAATCPAHPVAVHWPRDATATTTAPLFGAEVTAIRLCGYRGNAHGVQTLRGSTTLRGTQAQRLADSVDASPPGVRAISCPPPRYSRSVVLYPVSGTTSGTTVLLDATCGINVTDGRAQRLDWNPPSALRNVLDELTN
jgi:hypothetical protein